MPDKTTTSDRSVSVTREIMAPPEVVWNLVSDLPRMGEWSPENRGGSWIKGATGPAPGARFKGHNANGSKSWTTDVTVVDAIPGERFAFDVAVGPLKIAQWSFDIGPTANGCQVTETWTDRRSWLITKMGRMASGVSDRPTFNRVSMEQTLEMLARAATDPAANA
jgi:hypothetical protein